MNGRNSVFHCRSSNVAQRLEEVLKKAEMNNARRNDDEFPSVSSRYIANIHYPVFQRLPRSFYVNETDPVGSIVFKVSFSLFFQISVFVELSLKPRLAVSIPGQGWLVVGRPLELVVAMGITSILEVIICWYSPRSPASASLSNTPHHCSRLQTGHRHSDALTPTLQILRAYLKHYVEPQT